MSCYDYSDEDIAESDPSYSHRITPIVPTNEDQGQALSTTQTFDTIEPPTIQIQNDSQISLASGLPDQTHLPQGYEIRENAEVMGEAQDEVQNEAAETVEAATSYSETHQYGVARAVTLTPVREVPTVQVNRPLLSYDAVYLIPDAQATRIINTIEWNEYSLLTPMFDHSRFHSIASGYPDTSPPLCRVVSRPPPSTPPEQVASDRLSMPTLPALHHNSIPALIEQYRAERALSPIDFDAETVRIETALINAKLERGGTALLLRNEYTAELASRLDAETVERWVETRAHNVVFAESETNDDDHVYHHNRHHQHRPSDDFFALSGCADTYYRDAFIDTAHNSMANGEYYNFDENNEINHHNDTVNNFNATGFVESNPNEYDRTSPEFRHPAIPEGFVLNHHVKRRTVRRQLFLRYNSTNNSTYTNNTTASTVHGSSSSLFSSLAAAAAAAATAINIQGFGAGADDNDDDDGNNNNNNNNNNVLEFVDQSTTHTFEISRSIKDEPVTDNEVVTWDQVIKGYHGNMKFESQDVANDVFNFFVDYNRELAM